MSETSLAVIPTDETPIVLMSEKDARLLTQDIKVRLKDIEETQTVCRRLLHEVHSREGWRALGYADFVSYAKAEFNISKTHTYRLATAGKIEGLLHGEVTLSQSETAELSRLPDHLVAPTYRQAAALAAEQGVSLTPRLLKAAVDHALGIAPTTAKAPRKPRPPLPRNTLHVEIHPATGASEAKWRTPAAPGVTILLTLKPGDNIDAHLPTAEVVRSLAIAALDRLQNAEPAPAYASTLNPDVHTDY